MQRWFRSKWMVCALLGGAVLFSPRVPAAAMPWSDVSPGIVATTGPREIIPDRHRLVSVDRDALASLLARAPEDVPAVEALPPP